ncbi:PREDICTED: uncharacterized protein LOC109177282 [Ipomoea nil]|uniref:uncharacterized protein LOC109177282 n=1 Tax=Ipomoea nil TaxID=35883 RepID=UPI000900C389|nr:PREDICTED: uncharacterized protein LOC109177282 [Ipomoea nil]
MDLVGNLFVLLQHHVYAHGQWDEEVLRDLFDEVEVRRIIATPVANHLPDSWRWVGDIRGEYTVKHGYKLLTSSFTLSSTPGNFAAWDKLWKLPVPPKVHLLWRCTRGILPVRENLKLKNIWIGGGCPLCTYDSETAEHLFGGCCFARQLWKRDEGLQDRTVQSYMEELVNGTCTGKKIRMAAVFWMIWIARNDRIWRNKVWTVEATHNQIELLIATWNENYKREITVDQIRDDGATWEPPAPNWVKCNVDAALSSVEVAFGAAIRDHRGRFVAARNGWLICYRDPLMAEACAVKKSLEWLHSLGHNQLIVESDCLVFCNAFNSCNLDLSCVDLIVKQCKQIASDMGDVVVRHVRRSANRVAHVLAQATDSSSDSGSWSDVPPDCISDLLAQ